MTLDLSKIGDKLNYCFVNESLGVAFGFLIAVIHNAGLVSLTHALSIAGILTEAFNISTNKQP